jgi:hypothetical protein
MTVVDYSTLPVKRDDIDYAVKIHLSNQDAHAEITMIHPDGTDKTDIQFIIAGNDAIQQFALNLAIIVTQRHLGEHASHDIIANTFYGYTKYISEYLEIPGSFIITLPFEKDLFSALMSDPSLGLIDS